MAVCCNGGFAALVCEREVGILWAAPVCAFGLGLRRGTLCNLTAVGPAGK